MDIRQFARALQSKNLSRDTRWFADHIQLYTPIHKEPIVGREAVTQVLQLVFSIFENFHYPDVVPGAVWLSCPDLRTNVGEKVIDGADYLQTRVLTKSCHDA